MARKKEMLPLFEKVEILDAGAEGKAVGRVNERVIFVPFVVPGDVVDIQVSKKRKSYYEGRAIKFHHFSDKRTEPRCEHFGICGGCRWQNMLYEHQLYFKQKQVEDNLKRIGKFGMPEISPILSSENIFYYRNKLEYTFSNKRWLTDFSKDVRFEDRDMNGIGFHITGMFDRIVDVNHCHLQDEPSNAIRLALKQYALDKGLTFWDVKKYTGFLRNLIIRLTSTGELMVILVFGNDDKKRIVEMMKFTKAKFPQINSLFYVINEKHNDIISDLEPVLFSGTPYIIEHMENLKFKIGPVSFFQTNSHQALKLYTIVREFAGLKGSETVYDLYTGTGSIALFIAERAVSVVGIESVTAAIEDARENARLNRIENARFFIGDIAKTLNEEFILDNGKPDVVITDPPRAGMHPAVVEQLLNMESAKIVYVSCNPATQARDVTFLAEKYTVKKIQPVDMFPHTQHVENVMLLERI